MARKAAMVVFGMILLAIGWVAGGMAQTGQPDFEIVVKSPAGATTIECVRGCNLAWVERGVNPNAVPQPQFKFECGGLTTSSCSSSRVGGWIVR